MGLLDGKTLAAAVAPGDTHLTITPPLALGDNPAGQPIQIGTELMMVTGGKRGVLGLARAADSAHTQGTAITELNPFVATPEGAGGAIAVDNTVDPPAEVTTIIAVGAEIVGDEATLRGKDFYAQDDDPGAVGTGSVWKDTSGLPYNWYERNATDDGWDARVRVTATATGADNTDVGTTAIVVDGGAIADSSAEATGDGGASAQINATSVTGEALAYQVAATTDGVADAHAAATATGTGMPTPPLPRPPIVGMPPLVHSQSPRLVTPLLASRLCAAQSRRRCSLIRRQPMRGCWRSPVTSPLPPRMSLRSPAPAV